MAPSSPLVVKMVGMERRQLSWQRGRREITIAGMGCRIYSYLGGLRPTNTADHFINREPCSNCVIM
jgi:hypothetical protein